MRLVLQRVSSASVKVWGQVVGEINRGILVFAAAGHDDTPATAAAAAKKVAEMRIFSDDDAKMSRSITDIAGDVLVVSQFTLLGDTSKGRRPSFMKSAPADVAEPLIQVFADELRALGIFVEQGRFGSNMQVELINDGPVTLVVDV